jgi:hypothetical protein
MQQHTPRVGGSPGKRIARLGSRLFGVCALAWIACRILFFVMYPGTWRAAGLRDEAPWAHGVLTAIFIAGFLGGGLCLVGIAIDRFARRRE